MAYAAHEGQFISTQPFSLVTNWTIPKSVQSSQCIIMISINYIIHSLIIKLCYVSTLCLIHYALLLTPACWKYNNTNARLIAFAPSLALDPTFGIHSPRTLDTAQPFHLLKPNWKPSSSHSIFIPTNISTQFLLQSLCMCVARVFVCFSM